MPGVQSRLGFHPGEAPPTITRRAGLERDGFGSCAFCLVSDVTPGKDFEMLADVLKLKVPARTLFQACAKAASHRLVFGLF